MLFFIFLKNTNFKTMKKKLLQFIILFLGISFGTARGQIIANASFESWSNNGIGRLDVDDWFTSNTNNSLSTTIFQVGGHTGNYPVKMIPVWDFNNNHYVGGSLDLYGNTGALRPIALNGYWKQQNSGGLFTGVNIDIYVYDATNAIIGEGSTPSPINGSPSYPTFTAFSVPISYTSTNVATEYTINIYYASQTFTDFGVVDDLSFSSITGVNDLNVSQKLIRSYPNPAKNKITIESDLNDCLLEIRNISGSILIRKSIQTQKFELDISKFDCGIYFITLSDKHSREIHAKFIKE